MPTYDKTPKVFNPGDTVRCIIDRRDLNGHTGTVVQRKPEFKGDPVYQVVWDGGPHLDKLFYSWALELERGPW